MRQRLNINTPRVPVVFRRLGLVGLAVIAMWQPMTHGGAFVQFAAYNKVPGEKRVLLYPEFGHEDIYGLPDEILQFLLAD